MKRPELYISRFQGKEPDSSYVTLTQNVARLANPATIDKGSIVTYKAMNALAR